ncbi:tail fiber domain-containing protein, partial [Burkholderia cenocepacia]
DARLKHDVEIVSSALARIRSIRGVGYTLNSTGARSYGLIAQEIRDAFPHAVSEIGAGEGKEDYLGVNYSALIAPLIEAVKELADEVDALKAERA